MSEQIGEFSLKHNGNTYGTNSAGEMTSSANFVGEASGFGAVWGTITATNALSDAGATSGDCEWVGEAFLEDGSVLGGIGKGTWETPGNEHIWKVTMHVNLSNGDKHRSEGSMDLETLIYSGKIYSVD
ncbi:MAG: hypothetical protein NZ837_05655 [Gammaproteobacteria bacterium]|nr:hypothetical protein [Gammaproteobacteria bacterium]|tara:strand:- start:182 stop:565 length:384 start_codon:yes stop_codon:yes gene_type:complete